MEKEIKSQLSNGKESLPILSNSKGIKKLRTKGKYKLFVLDTKCKT
jgi:hypothetical protein